MAGDIPHDIQLTQSMHELETLLEISNRQKIEAATLLAAALGAASRIINDPTIPAHVVVDVARFHLYIASAVAALTRLDDEDGSDGFGLPAADSALH